MSDRMPQPAPDDEPQVVSTSALTETDLWHRDIMRDVLLKSNAVATDYAKQLIAVTAAAIGVVTALAELSGRASFVLIAIICLGYLASAAIFVSVIFPRRTGIAPHDYFDAPRKLMALADRRRRLNLVGSWVTAAMTVAAVVVLLVA